MTIFTRPQWCIEPLRPQAGAATPVLTALLVLGDCDSAPGLLGGRFRASTITCCVGTGRTEGRLRPRHPVVAWPGVAVISSVPAHALLPIVQSATLASRRARWPRSGAADAEVDQRDGSPGTRCRSACASEHLVNATVRSAADRATRQCQHRRAARSQCLAKSRAGSAAALAASGR